MCAAEPDKTEPERARLQFAAWNVTNWKQKQLHIKFTGVSPNRLFPVTQSVLDSPNCRRNIGSARNGQTRRFVRTTSDADRFGGPRGERMGSGVPRLVGASTSHRHRLLAASGEQYGVVAWLGAHFGRGCRGNHSRKSALSRNSPLFSSGTRAVDRIDDPHGTTVL